MYLPTMRSLSATTYLAEPPARYDRTPPRNIGDYPTCASQAVHDTAHRNCRPMVVDAMLRGLGLLDLNAANPCWVETLPICPVRTPPKLTPVVLPPRPPVRTPPKLTAVVLPPRPPVRTPPKLTPVVLPSRPPVRTPPQLTPVAPPPSSTVRPPPRLSAPSPQPVVAAPPQESALPPFSPLPEEAPLAPAQAGFSTGGLLAIVAAVGVGGWLLFGRKKPAA